MFKINTIMSSLRYVIYVSTFVSTIHYITNKIYESFGFLRWDCVAYGFFPLVVNYQLDIGTNLGQRVGTTNQVVTRMM